MGLFCCVAPLSTFGSVPMVQLVTGFVPDHGLWLLASAVGICCMPRLHPVLSVVGAVDVRCWHCIVLALYSRRGSHCEPLESVVVDVLVTFGVMLHWP